MFRRAFEISRADQTEDAVSPMLLVNYARTLRELHQIKEAADYAERGYTKAQRSGAQVVIGQSLLLRAQIYMDQGDLQRAAAMLDEVEPRLRKGLPAGHIAFTPHIASSRALLAQAHGDLQAALELSTEAVTLSEAAMKTGRLGGDHLPTFLLRRSDVELQLGYPDRAEADGGSRFEPFCRRPRRAGSILEYVGSRLPDSRAGFAITRQTQRGSPRISHGCQTSAKDPRSRSSRYSQRSTAGRIRPPLMACRQSRFFLQALSSFPFRSRYPLCIESRSSRLKCK